MDLSILIINNNRYDFLKKCLRSIYAETHKFQIRVVVLHNACAGQDPELERTFVQVKFIDGKQKRGFAANQNELLKAFMRDSRYCMLLNEDTAVMPGALEKMLRFMENHPEAACTGARLLFPGGQPQFSGGSFPSLGKEIFRFSGLGRAILPPKLKMFLGKYLFWLFPQESRLYLKSFYSPQPYIRVDYVSGCAMMISSRALLDIGLLDEGYIMYAEDLDWCKRASLRGWESYLIKEAEVVHCLNQSRPEEVMLCYEQSMLRYFYKHNYPKLNITVYRFIIAFICLFKIAYYYLSGAKKTSKANLKIFKFMLQGTY